MYRPFPPTQNIPLNLSLHFTLQKLIVTYIVTWLFISLRSFVLIQIILSMFVPSSKGIMTWQPREMINLSMWLDKYLMYLPCIVKRVADSIWPVFHIYYFPECRLEHPLSFWRSCLKICARTTYSLYIDTGLLSSRKCVYLPYQYQVLVRVFLVLFCHYYFLTL